MLKDPELAAVEDEQFVQHLKTFVLRPENFAAGFLRQHVAAWGLMFATSGHSFKSREVLDWVKQGVQLDFVSPYNADQQRHQKYAHRLQLVKQLLATVYSHRLCN